MSDKSLISFRSLPLGQDYSTWQQTLYNIAALCGGGRVTASRIKSQNMILWGLVCSMLFITGAVFPAKAEDCLKKIEGAARPPAQADENFTCLKDKIDALQKANEKILNSLTTVPRVQSAPCHYDGHDHWTCSVGCAAGETVVSGWCGGADNNDDVVVDRTHIDGGGREFGCAMRQILHDHPPTQVSVAAFCVRSHG